MEAVSIGGLTKLERLSVGARFYLPGARPGETLKRGCLLKLDGASALVEVEGPSKTVHFRGKDVTFDGKQTVRWSRQTLVMYQGGGSSVPASLPEPVAERISKPPSRKSSRRARVQGPEEVRLCFCGCGGVVRGRGSRFVRGHGLPHYKRLRDVYFEGEPLMNLPESVRARWGMPESSDESGLEKELASHHKIGVGALRALRTKRREIAKTARELSLALRAGWKHKEAKS